MTAPLSLTLTDAELALLIEALDSHDYWQLTDEADRNDAASQVEDGKSAEIDECRTLCRRLETIQRQALKG